MTPTPDQRAAALLAEPGNIGTRLRRHVAPPLVEDLRQAIAQAIREAVEEAISEERSRQTPAYD